ncbi:sphingosine-1-phosphate phosphatase 2-like [Patiria miniata]|uniref:Phosphatidic acid phosphatase type 2/haloperoxidase domain-containing protein n=1 Tax=Patiria miniata TaxID=46514 RepID=A0A914BHN4_PATMI|nr:sphingosine-1-phosphate phosphatase 2-like [Patiria miniata]
MKAIPETSLPLYNEEYVAQLQRFFGLELASKTAGNGDLPNGNGDMMNDDLTSGSGDHHHVHEKDRGTTYFHLKQRRQAPEAEKSSGEREREEGPTEADGPDPPDRYRVHSWFWYGIFSFGALLGDDLFYFFIFSFGVANFSWWVTRRLLMVWGFCMFVGQACKEILRWPRPREPPVVRLESRYNREYGMPSTHAVVGTLMPFTLLVSTWNHYEYPHLLGFVLACNWTLLVCCSRLYRGMHFILDLIAGVTLAALLMALIWPWLDTLDHFSLTHPYAPVIIITVSILLIIVYPTPDGIGASRNDTVSILGTVGGGLCAFWCNHYFGLVPDAHAPLGGTIKWPDLPTAGIMLARYFTYKSSAIIVFFGQKFIIKQILRAGFNIPVNVSTKRWLSIQLLYGYIPHVCTMLVMYQLGPRACTWFGLD